MVPQLPVTGILGFSTFRGDFYVLWEFLRFGDFWDLTRFLRFAAYGLSPNIFSRGYNVTKLLSFAPCLDMLANMPYNTGMINGNKANNQYNSIQVHTTTKNKR